MKSQYQKKQLSMKAIVTPSIDKSLSGLTIIDITLCTKTYRVLFLIWIHFM